MEDLDTIIEDYAEEEKQNEAVKGEVLPNEEESTFLSILIYQLILCICVIIILILINTFFKKEFVQVDSFLRNEMSAQENFKEDFDSALIFLNNVFGSIKPMGTDNQSTTSQDTTSQEITSQNTSSQDTISQDNVSKSDENSSSSSTVSDTQSSGVESDMPSPTENNTSMTTDLSSMPQMQASLK